MSRFEVADFLIDVFEDFLDKKAISIPNRAREQEIKDGAKNLAIIYGEDYDELYDDILRILEQCKF